MGSIVLQPRRYTRWSLRFINLLKASFCQILEAQPQRGLRELDEGKLPFSHKYKGLGGSKRGQQRRRPRHFLRRDPYIALLRLE